VAVDAASGDEPPAAEGAPVDSGAAGGAGAEPDLPPEARYLVADPEWDRDRAREEAREIQEKLRKLGGVNLEALDELQDLWYKSFGYWSNEDLDKGQIFRWVDNAESISKVEIKDTPQQWASALLTRQFENLDFDNGPHSFTRVVLRNRLLKMAKGDDAAKRIGAINTLRFMKEQGVLLNLRDASGETGKLASEAYHELLNPKLVTGVKMPDEEKKSAKQ